jgi:FMN-dependent NADH-azoreductase
MEHTMNILQINSSARSEGSQSTRLANKIVERVRAANPGATLTVRDLIADAASGARRSGVASAVHPGRPTDA